MPSNKFKTRFPPARIKKIMQTDEEVGKVAAPVPVIVSKSVELFTEILLQKSGDIAVSKGARTLSIDHIKQCVEHEHKFDFLREIVQEAAAKAVGKSGEEVGGNACGNTSVTLNVESRDIRTNGMLLRRSQSAAAPSKFNASDTQSGPSGSSLLPMALRTSSVDPPAQLRLDHNEMERSRMSAIHPGGYPSMSTPADTPDDLGADLGCGFNRKSTDPSTMRKLTGRRRVHSDWNEGEAARDRSVSEKEFRPEFPPKTTHSRRNVFAGKLNPLSSGPPSDNPVSPFLFGNHNPTFPTASSTSMMDSPSFPVDGYTMQGYNPQLMMMLMHQQQNHQVRPHEAGDIPFNPFSEPNEYRGARLPVYPSPRDYPGAPPVNLPNPTAASGAQDLSRKRSQDVSDFISGNSDPFYRRYQNFQGHEDSMNI